MKKLLFIIPLLIFSSNVFAQIRAVDISQSTGNQWRFRGTFKIGNGTPSTTQAEGDLYVTGDIEIPGAVYLPSLGTAGKLLWLDSNSQVQVVTLGSGLTFDPMTSTLSAAVGTISGILTTAKIPYASGSSALSDSVLTYNSTLDTFGFVASSPIHRIDARSGSSMRLDALSAPGAATAALAGSGAGNVDNGTHVYRVTYNTAIGETTQGSASATVTVVDKTVNGQVSLTSIPISSEKQVTSRNIYRTKAGGSTYFLLTIIADNTTTTFTDNVADSSLGATNPPVTNTTGASFWSGSTRYIQLGSNDVGIGTDRDDSLSSARLLISSTSTAGGLVVQNVTAGSSTGGGGLTAVTTTLPVLGDRLGGFNWGYKSKDGTVFVTPVLIQSKATSNWDVATDRGSNLQFIMVPAGSTTQSTVLTLDPQVSTSHAFITAGQNDITGGNASGTYWGANPTAFTGDWFNLQVNGTSRVILSNAGLLTLGSGTTTPGVTLNGATGTTRTFRIQTNGINRWGFGSNGTAEGGSNAGSNFEMDAYDDSGVLLGIPFFVVRSAATVQFRGLAGTAGPPASASTQLIRLGPNDISGGSANGTYLAANPSAFTGDFFNFLVSNSSKIKGDSSGNVTATGTVQAATLKTTGVLNAPILVTDSSGNIGAGTLPTGKNYITKVIAASNTPGSPSADYVCDGTDDQVEINSAITALSATGGKIKLLAGTYTFGNGAAGTKDVLVNQNKITIEGEGRTNTIINRGYNPSSTSDGALFIVSATASNFSLKGVFIDNKKITYTNANNFGIYAQGSLANGFMEDVEIDNSITHVYVFGGMNDYSITKCIFYNATNESVYMTSTGSALRCNVSYNYIYGAGTFGIRSSGGGNSNTFEGNTIASQTTNGIYTYACSNSKYNGNFITGGQQGIYVTTSSSYNTISFNTITACTAGGIVTTSSSEYNKITHNIIYSVTGDAISGNASGSSTADMLEITDNALYTPTGKGIGLLAVSKSIISRNKIYNAGGSGATNAIEISSNSDDNLISDNSIEDTAGTGKAISVADSTCDNNILQNNHFKGTGATAINDSGTTTKLVNQYDGNTIVTTSFENRFKRVDASIGATALVNTDIALSGWGTGATVAVATGSTDMAGTITITAGTTPSANPTATITWKDGAFKDSSASNLAPFMVASWNTSGTGTVAQVGVNTTATTGVLTYFATPVNASTYAITWHTIGGR